MSFKVDEKFKHNKSCKFSRKPTFKKGHSKRHAIIQTSIILNFFPGEIKNTYLKPIKNFIQKLLNLNVSILQTKK